MEGEQRKRKLALIFPGQGSQHVGMGRRLYEMSQAARRVFAQADEVLGFRLSKLCFEGPEEELGKTTNAQSAILVTSIAYLAYLRERAEELGRRLTPSVMAGHSLGQVSAAVATGSLDFGDALRVVHERGRMMTEWALNRPGGLASVLGLSEEDVKRVCSDASNGGEVSVAVVNEPGQTVISGDVSALQRAMSLARKRGGRAIRLPISVPGHIPAMRDIARDLSRLLSAIPFRDPQPPIVSSISGRLLTTAEEVRQELAEQICSAVAWARCFMAMRDEDVSHFLEVGPGHALSRIGRRLSAESRLLAVEETAPDDLLRLGVPGVVPMTGEGMP